MFQNARTAAALCTVLTLSACNNGAGGEQTLVDRAALTVQEFMTQTVSREPRTLLQRAKGALICPRVFKAGFFFGGEGGSCVLLARAGNGTWSYPTFYDIGSGSFGFQFGVQDSQLLLLILTTKGLNAVMDSQVRLGASVSVAVATVGAGVQGATTAAVGADIVAFAAARGLFGGVSLEGGVISARIDENQAYYGQPFAARQIVLQMRGVNQGADPLREVLTRYGGPDPAVGPQGPGGWQQPYPQTPPAYPPQGQYQQPAPQGYAPQGYPSLGPAPQGYAPQGYAPRDYPPAGAPPAYPPSYQPPAAPPSYQAPRTGAAPPQSFRPPPAPSYAAPDPRTPPSGYQPPPGQYIYPPPSGAGPIQEQALPPPR